MRGCVVGGGLAGSMLAWRLAHAGAGWQVDLVTGSAGSARGRVADATGASGGAVRCYETEPEQRWLAVASLVELLGSATLREWAGYRRTGSVYLRPAGTDRHAVAAEVADIERGLPGSARLVDGPELERAGWAGLH
ncbi:MAG TPA: FAD-dependent oxidoreductase, partial [Pseudonocardiaceae bacterium]